MHKSVDNVLYYVHKAHNNNAIATSKSFVCTLLNLKLTENS